LAQVIARKGFMNSFDDNSKIHAQPPGEDTSSEQLPTTAAEPVLQPPDSPVFGDPISLAAAGPSYPSSGNAALPEDLRISWSWFHFALFLLFVLVSFFAVQGSFMAYYAAPLSRLSTEKDFEQFVLSKPGFAVGSMILVYASAFLFLYISLALYPGSPFWRTLGWRSITRSSGGKPWIPWLYFFSGCGLSVLVFIVTAKIHPPEDVPIEEIFHYKNTAMLFMAMAVLVAPLVEETVFRGYLYPLLAKSFGVATGVIVTGVLFGLMHGAQLGWTWGLVSVLIMVGVIFTFVRARTGSVFASFLLHLGYNSMIALATILSTSGFTNMSPTH
jgi:membrane protease YdiL (CAAX protease family)